MRKCSFIPLLIALILTLTACGGGTSGSAVGVDVSGTWVGAIVSEGYVETLELVLEQNGSRLSGDVYVDGIREPIDNARIEGRSVTIVVFIVENGIIAELEGQVNRNIISGVARNNDEYTGTFEVVRQ